MSAVAASLNAGFRTAHEVFGAGQKRQKVVPCFKFMTPYMAFVGSNNMALLKASEPSCAD